MPSDVRQKVRDILFDNAVNLIAEQPRTIGITGLLCMASYKMYNIERMMSKWFGDTATESMDLVGKVRHPCGTWGRPYSSYHDLNGARVSMLDDCPFVKVGSCYHNVSYTPVSDDCIYSPIVKYMAETGDSDNVADIPMLRSLYKEEPTMRTIWWRNDITKPCTPVELNTFYYEKSERLINELAREATEENTIANDVGGYRAIYHTPVKSHMPIIQYLEHNIFIIHGGHISDKLKYVRLAYWLLSNAMLFEQGSASIINMVCCVLWRWIGMDGALTSVADKDANMEAILSTNQEMWELMFSNVVTTRKQSITNGVPLKIDQWLRYSFSYNDAHPLTCINDIEDSLYVDDSVGYNVDDGVSDCRLECTIL